MGVYGNAWGHFVKKNQLVRFPRFFLTEKLALWWRHLQVFTKRGGKGSRVLWVQICCSRLARNFGRGSVFGVSLFHFICVPSEFIRVHLRQTRKSTCALVGGLARASELPRQARRRLGGEALLLASGSQLECVGVNLQNVRSPSCRIYFGICIFCRIKDPETSSG